MVRREEAHAAHVPFLAALAEVALPAGERGVERRTRNEAVAVRANPVCEFFVAAVRVGVEDALERRHDRLLDAVAVHQAQQAVRGVIRHGAEGVVAEPCVAVDQLHARLLARIRSKLREKICSRCASVISASRTRATLPSIVISVAKSNRSSPKSRTQRSSSPASMTLPLVSR